MSVALLVGPQGCIGQAHARQARSVHCGYDTKAARVTHVSYGGSPLVLQQPPEGHGPSKGEPEAAKHLEKEPEVIC